MNPHKVSRGSSFKGTAAYLLSGHIGEENPERAEWSATQNVGTDDIELAARIMAATWYDADNIKRENGGKAGGRPTTKKPVLHLVMSWDEGQTPDAAHMEQAARDMLKHMGLEKAQAAMVGHNDSKNPHLHIMVNMIDPETGKNIDLGNDLRKMQSFAKDYCREHGITSSPNREKNAEMRAEAKRTGDTSQLEKMEGRKRLSRKEWQEMKTQLLDRQATEREALKKQHGAEWARVASDKAARQAQERAQWRVESEKQRAILKAENKPQWAELFKRQDRERKAAAAAIREAERKHRRAQTLLARALSKIGVGQTRQETAQAVMAANLRGYEQQGKHKAERDAKQKAQGETRSKRTKAAMDQWRAARPIDRTAIDRMKAEHHQQREALQAQQNTERVAVGIKPYEPKPRPQEAPQRAQEATPAAPQVRTPDIGQQRDEALRQERLRDGLTRHEQQERSTRSKWGDRPLSDDAKKAADKMRDRDREDRQRGRDDYGRDR